MPPTCARLVIGNASWVLWGSGLRIASEGGATENEYLVQRCWPSDVKMRLVFKTIEAEVDEKGRIRPKEKLTAPPGSRLLVTVLAESDPSEAAFLAEASLAEDWQRPEEDAAWSHLSRG